MATTTIDFSHCNRAHPYWLSTIRNFYLPQPPDAGAPLSVLHIATAASALKQGSVDRFESTIAALESEGAVGEAFAVSWINAMRTLVWARNGRFDEARRCSVLSLEWPDAPAEFSHNRAIVEVRLGNVAEAVKAFRAAVEVAPSFGPSWAALALIYALARAHDEAEEAARMARGLDTTVGNDLVGLSLMQATYILGKPLEGAFFLPPEDRWSTSGVENALSRLPSIELPDWTHPGDDRPIVFIACDQSYLLLHAVPLIWSLADTGSICSIHLHVINPEGDLEQVRKMVRPVEGGCMLILSTEQIALQNRDQQLIYYSSVRFCRLYQLATQNPGRTIVFLDADMLVRKDIAGFPGLSGSDKEIGLRHCAHDPIWQEISAAAGWIRATPRAIRFLGDVAMCIVENIVSGHARWFLDQFALYVAWDRLADKELVHLCDEDQIADHHYSDESLIWAAGNDKGAHHRYASFKRQLSARHDPEG